MICGRALPLAEAVDDAKLLRSRLRLAWRPHAPPADVWSRKCFSPPFRSGTAHIVFLWMVSLDRPIPGRTEKRHHRPDDTAQQRDKDGPVHRECSPGTESRTTQFLPCGSK
jgi:hypothetical protein